MEGIATYRRLTITISIIVLSVFLLIKCINKQSQDKGVIQDIDGKQFAGSAVCASCHKNIYDSHIQTAHYLTSQPASDKYIRGSFESGENTFVYNNQVRVVMEKRRDGFYQVEYREGVEKKSGRFDVVIGSATKGQTYLYWLNNQLFQLPVSYFPAAHQWSNSPGYPGRVVFNRPITSRCLECHSTYAQVTSARGKEPEEFDHNKILFGVDCEKCHGPAASHVAFQLQNPKDTATRHIINPALLTRQQNLDLCILCHGGRLNKTKPSFSFEAGDKLSDYFRIDTAGKRAADIDVHGNQYGLLAASKCFTMSKMTCGSCHSPHEKESGNLVLFSRKCMTCHNDEHDNTCKMTAAIGPAITQNCIDCHMPKQPSRAIVFLLEGGTATAALIRTHLIKTYPDETKKVLAGIHKSQNEKTVSQPIKE